MSVLTKQLVEPAKKLPTFQDECILDCVHPKTVRQLITGGYKHLYDRVMVIDCRFDFEYEGGHLKSNFPWLTVSWCKTRHTPALHVVCNFNETRLLS
jgi:hypothetical protein